MARSKDAAGTAIAAAVKAVGIAPGVAVTDSQLEAVWKAAMNALFVHDAANAVINSTVSTTGSVISGAGAGGNTVGTGTAVNVGGIT